MTSKPHPPSGDAQAPPARITPGLIVSILSISRLAEVARQLDTPVPILAAAEPRTPDPITRRMLSMLNDVELRKLAALVDAPADGHFVDLYRRLSQLC
jgi:predicted unusual protein kinase regulating ubiquinone biosynthesis (AarF/ABC1/UbiB family)